MPTQLSEEVGCLLPIEWSLISSCAEVKCCTRSFFAFAEAASQLSIRKSVENLILAIGSDCHSILAS